MVKARKYRTILPRVERSIARLYSEEAPYSSQDHPGSFSQRFQSVDGVGLPENVAYGTAQSHSTFSHTLQASESIASFRSLAQAPHDTFSGSASVSARRPAFAPPVWCTKRGRCADLPFSESSATMFAPQDLAVANEDFIDVRSITHTRQTKPESSLRSDRRAWEQHHGDLSAPLYRSTEEVPSVPLPLPPFALIASISPLPVRVDFWSGDPANNVSKEMKIQANQSLTSGRCYLRVAVTKLPEDDTYEVWYDRICERRSLGGRRHQRLHCVATKQHALEQIYQNLTNVLKIQHSDFADDLLAYLNNDQKLFEDILLVIARQLYMLLPEE